MSLDYELLSSALTELEFELGRSDCWEEITEESGVINVKSMAKGLVNPTIESWLQLHKAFPGRIPPPEIIASGKTQYIKSANNSK